MIFPYYSKKAFQGNISGYCAVEDYHTEVMLQLKSIINKLSNSFPGEVFVPFVDVSPVDEVDGAVKAGLGVRGRNGLLITKNHGSFVFIGEILTTLLVKDDNKDTDLCSDCKRCIAACPGKAITPNGIDKKSCASFISQKKGELSQIEKDILKSAKTVFGCDICQKVCLDNKNIVEKENLFTHNVMNTLTLDNIMDIYRERAFGYKGSEILKRNIKIYNE